LRYERAKPCKTRRVPEPIFDAIPQAGPRIRAPTCPCRLAGWNCAPEDAATARCAAAPSGFEPGQPERCTCLTGILPNAFVTAGDPDRLTSTTNQGHKAPNYNYFTTKNPKPARRAVSPRAGLQTGRGPGMALSPFRKREGPHEAGGRPSARNSSTSSARPWASVCHPSPALLEKGAGPRLRHVFPLQDGPMNRRPRVFRSLATPRPRQIDRAEYFPPEPIVAQSTWASRPTPLLSCWHGIVLTLTPDRIINPMKTNRSQPARVTRKNRIRSTLSTHEAQVSRESGPAGGTTESVVLRRLLGCFRIPRIRSFSS